MAENQLCVDIGCTFGKLKINLKNFCPLKQKNLIINTTLLFFGWYVNVICHNYTFPPQILPSCFMSNPPTENLQPVNVPRDAL